MPADPVDRGAATDNPRPTTDDGRAATDDSGATTDDGGAATVDRLAERLDAVERALTGSDRSVDSIADAAAAADERTSLADRLSTVETRVDELEAATQAVRGYTGAIRAVNRDVERRADLALARATAAHDGYTDDEALVSGDRQPEDATHLDESALAAAVPSSEPHTDATAVGDESTRDGLTVDDTESVPSRALERLRERV